ncbi:S1C family serine protease [Frigoriglobus tundricola]|uniref:PDZ domain-containing protein n=1 Tax=Frigoriglobus tundricola TaxID=2774151 RepID=A0A6M5YSW6_9BACT|nr:PDZ domain-containing protein [Frigoriglobus tundricola]QJW96042.1 hypothetical protein FTUN_3596 [Frigoriglobus tundricola]
MIRAGMCVATGVLATVATWAGVAHFTPADAAPVGAAREDTKPTADAKPVDLTALRASIEAATNRGENVDEVRKAFDAFEKSAPKTGADAVPSELQTLRDAVDAAARKGEAVEAIAKELAAVETAVAGRSLAKPRPEPRREPDPSPNPGFLPFPNADIGGVDPKLFNKAMELQRRAKELMLKNPRDPEAIKEAQRLRTEAAELLLKAARGGGAGGLPIAPLFPDLDRNQDRVRFGIRMDRVPAVAADQLGLEPNTGIVVALVMPGTAAEKAGLKMYDIILEFAGKPVTDNTEDFAQRVNDVKAGEKVDLVLLRKGKKVEVKGIELPDVPRRPAQPQPLPFPALPLPGLAPQAAPAPLQLLP